VTAIDWVIVAAALGMAMWGYQQGFLVGLLTLAGFAGGAFLGSRIAPALLADGSESPYAPVLALAGAVFLGGMVAVTLEAIAISLRARVVCVPAIRVLDGAGGAALAAALALGLAWILGAVALHTPNARELRRQVQRSEVLQRLNAIMPPSGAILNVLNRIDPTPEIEGPSAAVGPPDPRIARDPEIARAGNSVVKVLGTACGLGIEGSGWVATPSLVVTNAHVVAGEDDTTVTLRSGEKLDATTVHYDPGNDIAVLRVSGISSAPLPLVGAPKSGTAGAVLGYPHNGPYAVAPARVGKTQTVITQDSYGRGPVRRQVTSLRGRVASGNSGGPMVDGRGRVLTTVFASVTGGRAGGFGVPNAIVRDALSGSGRPVSTEPCAR
jgi:S1-C subfamily serine protease